MTSEDILSIAGFEHYDDGLWRKHTTGDGSVDGILELLDVATIKEDDSIEIKRTLKLAGTLDLLMIDFKIDEKQSLPPRTALRRRDLLAFSQLLLLAFGSLRRLA